MARDNTSKGENEDSTAVPSNDNIPPKHNRGKNKIISSMIG